LSSFSSRSPSSPRGALGRAASWSGNAWPNGPGGHRQVSETHAAKAQEHEEQAREAAERAERERELSQRHGEKAENLEREL